MKIPSYWAEHTLAFHNPNSRKADKTSHIKRFGWSDISMDEAKRHAVERCEQARQAYKNKAKGERVNFAEGIQNYDETPIREEVLQRYDELNCVTTINSYGATCLNVEDVMILDVDKVDLKLKVVDELQEKGKFPKEISSIFVTFFSFVLTIVVYGYLGFSLFQSFLIILFLWGMLNITLAFYTHLKIQKVVNYEIQKRGGFLAILEEWIYQLNEKNGNFAFNLYQTPNGFRLIALQDIFLVDNEAFIAVKDILPIDGRYHDMCKVQQCYRARVTGKPWRMGIDDKPPKEFWKTESLNNQKWLEIRKDWLKNYNQIAPNYRACQFVKRVGNLDIAIHSKVAKVVALHDDLCQSDKELPLA